MINRSIQGNPVLPMTIKKAMVRSGKDAYRNEAIESGDKVYPRSLNADPDVKVAHQNLFTLISARVESYCGLSEIQSMNTSMPTI
jgi:hypothetical protein